MSKKPENKEIKLTLLAGKANPSPPVGPALGQHGLNIMEFCKAFNEKTASMEAGTPVPVVITVLEKRKFSFVVKLPPVSFWLKKAAKIKSGSALSKREKAIGSVTQAQCQEIAEKKLPDLNTTDVVAATKTVVGTAMSMGLTVTKG